VGRDPLRHRQWATPCVPPPTDCPAGLPANYTVRFNVDGVPDWAIVTTSCVPCMWFGYGNTSNINLMLQLWNGEWRITSSDPVEIVGYRKLCGVTPLGAYTVDTYHIGDDAVLTDLTVDEESPCDACNIATLEITGFTDDCAILNGTYILTEGLFCQWSGVNANGVVAIVLNSGGGTWFVNVELGDYSASGNIPLTACPVGTYAMSGTGLCGVQSGVGVVDAPH